MPDREKVIRGLECCLPPHDPDCDLCPYDSIDLRCRAKLHEDVMALLKAQEPRVMTIEEVQNAEIVWIEQVGTIVAALKVATSSERGIMSFAYAHDGGVFYVNIKPEHYGKISRCWTSRPADEQREATPWVT